MTDDEMTRINGYFATFFAPWIIELGLVAERFDATGADFTLPDNPRLVHGGGVICGQATASAADTCVAVTLAALNGRFRMSGTVDLMTHFVRPLKPGALDIRCEILSNGRRMAYARVDIRAKGETKIAVTANAAYAYLED